MTSSTSVDPNERRIVLARRASRWSAALTALGALMTVAGIGLAIQAAHSSDVERLDKSVRLKNAEAQLQEATEFIAGDRSSVVLGPTMVPTDIEPIVSYEPDGWSYSFRLALALSSDIAPHVRNVVYELDSEFYTASKREGVGPKQEARVKVAACYSSATARVSLDSGQQITLAFDWCKLAGWKPEFRYDASQVRGLEHFPRSCTKPSALLTLMHPDMLGRIGTVQIIRQLYRVDPRWRVTANSRPIEFEVHRSVRDAEQVAVVAKCSKPATCVAFAAAFYAVSGGMPPEVHCGKIPLVSDVSEPLAAIRQGAPPDELTPQSGWERCFRLSACEVATLGRNTQYPIGACTSEGVSRETLACAEKEACSEVLECAARH